MSQETKVVFQPTAELTLVEEYQMLKRDLEQGQLSGILDDTEVAEIDGWLREIWTKMSVQDRHKVLMEEK